jgi:hypothetical protein
MNKISYQRIYTWFATYTYLQNLLQDDVITLSALWSLCTTVHLCGFKWKIFVPLHTDDSDAPNLRQFVSNKWSYMSKDLEGIQLYKYNGGKKYMKMFI